MLQLKVVYPKFLPNWPTICNICGKKTCVFHTNKEREGGMEGMCGEGMRKIKSGVEMVERGVKWKRNEDEDVNWVYVDLNSVYKGPFTIVDTYLFVKRVLIPGYPSLS